MASYQDLLDAIARVRAATGNRDAWRSGLSGEDIAAACSAWSSPSALGGVLAKIVAAHPDAFVVQAGPVVPPPGPDEGLAAEAIRGAETSLAQQNSTAAQVDLQVVTAVLNAHAATAEGADELERLQREIETAVLSRTDLGTPTGAREFQRFLIGKLRDIRTVVDTAGLDATSKAALAAALASLYASAAPQPESQPAQSVSPSQPRPAPPPGREWGSGEGDPVLLPADVAPPWGLDDLPPFDFGGAQAEPLPAMASAPVAPIGPAPAMAAPAMPAPAMAGPAMGPTAPAWGSGLPSGMPFAGGGLSSPLPELGRPDPLPDRTFDTIDRLEESRREREAGPSEAREDPVLDTVSDEPEDPAAVHLPDGQTVSAPSPEVAAAMTAALAGTPIPEAFRQQGMTLPAPGTAVAAPLDTARLVPGDIGMLADRHALALGNGKALLDNEIKPIASVAAPGFLGWQHPPVPGAPLSPTTTEPPRTPEAPVPTRPAETAPS